MKANYAPFIDRVIQRYEGSYGWDQSDPGGPTKFGITCYDLAEHRGVKMTSMTTWAPFVRAMALHEAEDIYAAKYASGVRFNDLPSGADCVMLDYGINSGVSRPIHVARALLNQGTSGVMDQVLVDVIKRVDAKWFINSMCDERLHFMHAIRGGRAWHTFGRGWQARVDDLRKYTLNLSRGIATATPGPDLSHNVSPKVIHGNPDLKRYAGAAGGTTSLGAAAAAHHGGLPLWGAVLTAVAVAGGVAGFTVWRGYRDRLANTRVVFPSAPANPVAKG